MNNIDLRTVNSFGDEWTRFDHRVMPEQEAKKCLKNIFCFPLV